MTMRWVIALLLALVVSGSHPATAASAVQGLYDVHCSCGGPLVLVRFEKDAFSKGIHRMKTACDRCKEPVNYYCKESIEKIHHVSNRQNNHQIVPMSRQEMARLPFIGRWTEGVQEHNFDSDGELRTFGRVAGVLNWTIPDKTRPNEMVISTQGRTPLLYRWAIVKGDLRLTPIHPATHEPTGENIRIYRRFR